jgi:predicted  nucleic acid-binding Zn-ribbon protein
MEAKPELVQTIHRILRQKSELESQLTRGPRRVQVCKNAEAESGKQLEASQQELKRLRLLAADKQLQLKQRETKLEDLKGKRNSCSSNREYSLLNDQIAADQQANNVLADEILDTLESIDRQSEVIQAAQKHLTTLQQETARVQTDVEQRVGALQAELARVTSELRESEAGLPAELRTEYQHRVRTKGEEAFAVVEGGSCGNCHQVLTPHILDQLSMGRLHICSGCNSILYIGENISV